MERYEFALNSFLLVIIVALVVFLIADVHTSRTEIRRAKEKHGVDIVDIEAVPETRFQVTALGDTSIFDKNDFFAPVVTPIPTPTGIPIPTPTPAPPPFAENWQIVTIMGNVVLIRDYLGSRHYKKEGETLEGIVIVEVSQSKKYIRVRNTDGREKTIALGSFRDTKPKPPTRSRKK